MALGSTIATAILDALFNQSNWTAPTALWLSLHTADPGKTGASECADATYVRVVATAKFGAAADVAGTITVKNDTLVEFAALTTGATITHYGLWSASAAGTFYHGGDVNPDKVVGAGGIPQFAINDLVITA